MPLTLKIKYFNTFVLREEPTVTTAVVAEATNNGLIPPTLGPSTTVILLNSNTNIAQNMLVHGPGISGPTSGNEEFVTVSSIVGTTLTLSSAQKLEKGVTLTFSNAQAYPTGNVTQQAENEWHIEESRIKGGFNEKTVDFGAKAFIVDKNYKRNHRTNAMIYSGIYNSRTGVNDTNQFSIGENITKAVDSAYGSIQKLYAEDTNLIVFQENKVHNALIDKDAIFTAEGGGLSTTAQVVIGQITPYLGEFGIGTNPESFAVYGFRKYFVDKDRSAVLRLSRDGITEISSYGMKSFFRDNLRVSNRIQGMFDIHAKNYVISLGLTQSKAQNEQTFVSKTKAIAAESSGNKNLKIQSANNNIIVGMFINTSTIKDRNTTVIAVNGRNITLSSNTSIIGGEEIIFSPTREFLNSPIKSYTNYKTLAFDDKVNGWTSFFTYKPNFGGSVASNFYTWDGADLYKHYSSSDKNTFYGIFQPSTVTIISNQNPSLVKHYKTINYEGTNNWKVIKFTSPAEDSQNYNAYQIPGNITGRYIDPIEGIKFAGFVPLEKKYYANVIINDTSSITGISSLTTTGVKGFFAETILEHEPVGNNKSSNKKKHAELFSVGFNYEQSLY
jgi:hypothetical protein